MFACKEYAFKRDETGKNDEKVVKLEEKKFNHSVAMEENNRDHGIKLEEKKLDWENEEKEKGRSFEIAKLEKLALQVHIGKKYYLINKCVLSGKSTEEI
ncbi:hypothetical protein VP01_3973g9 [Puccinia sorghi]|uniref:Uncharacterized protein n=1 Tax=Puccinia sorghi TaxID=27349 RepID=A0A0L6UU75_9BASI|nr:hypothetical protein VP01_3973g9 [Puccinia sorghi]